MNFCCQQNRRLGPLSFIRSRNAAAVCAAVGALVAAASGGLPARADAPAVSAPAPIPAPTPAVKHFLELKTDARGHLGGGTVLQGVHRIVCLGDSITQWGDGPTGYVGLVRAYLTSIYPANGIEVINAGVAGNTAGDELARFDRDVLQKKPDLITISVGVNDVMHRFDAAHPQGDGPGGLPLDQYRADADKMVTSAQQQGITVVIFSPTVIGEDLGNAPNAMLVGYTNALHDIARSHKCLFVDLQHQFDTYIDIYRTTGHTDNLLAGDGVHMNDWGNRFMTATILTALTSPVPKTVTLHAP